MDSLAKNADWRQFFIAPADQPLLTSDLPGAGGVIKQHLEDFFVEEIPSYLPSGAGTHTFLHIEKRGIGTHDALRLLARALDRPARDFGYAGMKDARGITRQTVSIEHVQPAAIEALAFDAIDILDATPHEHKLRIGHTRGNRFVIRIREAGEDAEVRAKAVLAVLADRGVPNYFGHQRFGVRGTNALVGAAALRDDWQAAFGVLLGEPDATDHDVIREARELCDKGEYAQAAPLWPRFCRTEQRVCRMLAEGRQLGRGTWSRIERPLRQLYYNAAQSALFNRVLAERLPQIDRLQDGDLAWKHANGACFRVPDAAEEQPRCEAQDISPSGPIFGGKMTWPEAGPADIEKGVLNAAGLVLDRRKTRDGIFLDGARRPLRVPLGESVLQSGSDAHGAYLELRFVLPPGSYATAVLREICKSGPDGSGATHAHD